MTNNKSDGRRANNDQQMKWVWECKQKWNDSTRIHKKNRRQSMASVETMVSVMCSTLVHSNTSLYSYFRLNIYYIFTFIFLFCFFFPSFFRRRSQAAKSGEHTQHSTAQHTIHIWKSDPLFLALAVSTSFPYTYYYYYHYYIHDGN